MIRVMIVEDEPPIGRMLKNLIQKTDPAFKIVAAAENGKEAIQLYEQMEIDVIFTDIRMPVMDGFGLLEYLRAKQEDVFTVLVSGYDDFEYARKGIQYQVYDYLLKIVSPESLANLLERLKRDVQSHTLEKKRKSLQKAIDAAAQDGQPASGGNFKFCLLCAGSAPYSPEENMLPGSHFWASFDLEKAVGKALGAEKTAVSFWRFEGTTDVEQILIFEKNEGIKSKDIEVDLLRQMNREAGLPVTIVTHKGWISLGSISVSASRARSVLYEETVFSQAKLLFTEEDGEGEINAHQEEKLEKMILGCRNNRRFELGLFQEFCDTCRDGDMTQQNLLRCLNLLFSYMITGVSGRGFWDKEYDASALLSNLYTYEGLLAETAELFAVHEEAAFAGNPALPKIKRYLENHFAEPLTNERIAEEFGFASAYLCRIFKKQYGISLGGYLLQLRMDYAKRLLHKEPGIMVKEVAERVGFKDQFYFSKVFYRETGVWPTQFK